ncbi:hypothetical protein RI054_38g141950 [Pseudoscourfieldia marina]
MVRDAGDPGRARAEKVTEELEKLEKTAPKAAAAKSSRGKGVWSVDVDTRSRLSVLTCRTLPTPWIERSEVETLRNQKEKMKSLHIDPIKNRERTLCWSIGARATFAFGGKAWDVWDGALVGLGL